MAIDTTQHEQVVRDYLAWVNGDDSRADALSESVSVYNPGVPDGVVHSRAEWDAYLQQLRAGFSDLHIEEEEMLARDEIAMVEFRITGTHDGEFRGLPPTGRAVEVRGVEKFVIEDGRIRELYIYFDSQEIPEQLGLTFPAVLGQVPKLAWRKIT